MTVEYLSAFYNKNNDNDVLMIIIKLKELALYQRFFLDAAIGFWEEWNQEDTFYDLDDCNHEDIAKELNLKDKKVNSIKCSGSLNTLASISFEIGNISLLLKFKENDDTESDIVLIRL